MKLNNKGNKVVQYKLLLEDIKNRLNANNKKQYGAIYYKSRIEITEFCDEKFLANKSNYKTNSYKFTSVKPELHEDLRQAWSEVFGNDIKLQIVD